MTGQVMVLVPAWNEAATIGEVVRSVRRVLPEAPVLVIDDHSRDETAAAAAAAGARVVRLPKHLGLAGCLRAGYELALEASPEFVVRVDGDGQHEAADIPAILSALRITGADIVVGSRFISHGRWRVSRARSAGIALLRRVAAIHDPTSGFIGVNRRALELFARAQPPAYPEPGALIALKRLRCRVHEIPCRMYARRAGRSSMTFFNAVSYTVRVLARIVTDARGFESE